jgi:polyisoprenoid-binding protein YceI
MEKNVLALLIAFVMVVPGCAPATSAPTPADSPTVTASDSSPAAVDASTAAATADASPNTALKVIELTPDNTKIEFVGTKPEGKHAGGFTTFAGKLALAEDARTPAKIAVEIQTDSLWSDVDKLTRHLKSADFFEVKAYPQSTFVSTNIAPKQVGEATHEVTGDLTLRGITKRISFPVRISGGDELTLISDFTISRKEFGMTYGEGKVDDPVQITVAVKAPVN